MFKKKQTRNKTQKGANHENVDNLYEKYYDAFKSDYDTTDELTRNKKEKYGYKQFEIDDKISKQSKLDEQNE